VPSSWLSVPRCSVLPEPCAGRADGPDRSPGARVPASV
jgi:hypothetical protein